MDGSMSLIRPLLAALALLALTVAAGLSVLHAHAGDEDEEVVRVIARLSEDGRVEFGLRSGDGDQFPTQRYFPRGIDHHRWLRSSPILLPDGESVRIIARISPDERIEFGVRYGDPSEDILPISRYFPRDIAHNRWLQSSPIRLPDQATAQQPAAAPAGQDDSDPRPDQDDTDNQVEKVATGEGEPRVERISGGHRDGLIVNRNVVGDPDAAVLIADFGDPF